MSLSVHFDSNERPYTGAELRPHFLLRSFGLKGDAIGAFIGPCEVKTEELVDWEDRLVNDHIRARSMVHFIGEFFGMGLSEGVFLQRLFMASLGESLRATRDGDDLFVNSRKLSVSIVTASPVSVLLHAGINIDPEGAPVAAIGLEEIGVDARLWVPGVLERFASEWASMKWACAKVRPVV
jgi:hypothetical protein